MSWLLFKATVMWFKNLSRSFTHENNMSKFHIKYLLRFEIYAREICEKFVYKHSETIEQDHRGVL